jgi:single-stranded-DNA-specific exonuclease
MSANAVAPLPASLDNSAAQTNGSAVPSSLKRWVLAEPSSEARLLAQQISLPAIVAELLYARGIRTPAEAEMFLSPAFDSLHDPYTMKGMDVAAGRIQQAISRNEPILIFGDYDVDGTIAVVLLKTAIEMLGGVCRFQVPHRLRDGYGLQPSQVADAVRDGARVIVSVDNGIRAFAAAEEAKRLGVDLIVTDHHLPDPAGPPPAFAVLNPNQPGCPYPSKTLCGAGVAFKLAQALLESRDRERARQKTLPSFLKLLTIATIPDAVPLIGENRIFVSLGIQQLARPVQPGLRMLMELAGIHPDRLTPRDIAFRLAPRLNAAGRMDTARDVVDLFTTRDPVHARGLAETLDLRNSERREAEQTALQQIEEHLRVNPDASAPSCLVLDGYGWHRGVLGILASRVVDRTGKPALVLTHDEGEAFGSGRSVPHFHLLDALSTCGDLLSRFGGHAHAVGFSLPSARVGELRARMACRTAEAISQQNAVVEVECAAELPLDRLTAALRTWIARLQPFGMGNPEPIFIARRVRVHSQPRIMKGRHLRLRLSQAGSGLVWPAVGWNCADLSAELGVAENSVLDLAYKLRDREGDTGSGAELEIVDLHPSS